MPNSAASHIQKSAPGPPATYAVATPTMLPVPIVAESAVHSAPKLETSPFAPCSTFSFLNMYRSARGSWTNCIPPRRIVRKMPPNKISIIRSGTGKPPISNDVPQTLSSTRFT